MKKGVIVLPPPPATPPVLETRGVRESEGEGVTLLDFPGVGEGMEERVTPD